MSTPEWLESWSVEAGARRVRDLFAQTFADEVDGVLTAAEPAGVWSAPGRVNLIGEHTDYNAGLCLPIALPHRTFVALRLRDDDTVRVASAQTDDPWEMRLSDVAPGKVQGWGAYVAGVAWALQQAGYPVGGFDAVVDSCVPFGASLSSSASLECAFAVALDDLLGLGLRGDNTGRVVLVEACIRAENEIAGAATGGLDQAASLRSLEGHALLLDFRPELTALENATPIPFDLAPAGLELIVIDTRAPHQLVDGQYEARRSSCEEAAAVLGVGSLREITPESLDDALVALAPHDPQDVLQRRVRHVVTETARTAEFAQLVQDGRVAEVGPLMVASHYSLRVDYEVTVTELDLAVDSSLAAGAIGARMTGGGFGGSAIALVPADQVEQVVAAVQEAFDDAGLRSPAFLLAPPSGPAS